MVSRKSYIASVGTEREHVIEKKQQVLRIGEEGIRGDNAMLCFFRRVRVNQSENLHRSSRPSGNDTMGGPISPHPHTS
jgi:hypothetical protein